MMKPTIGRVVYFFGPVSRIDRPECALVVYVHDEYMVNLAVFDHNGVQRAETSVYSKEAPVDSNGGRWDWMPYQKQKAAVGDHNSESAEPRPETVSRQGLEVVEDSTKTVEEEEVMSQLEESNKIGREKYWDELDQDEKINRMREVIKALENKLIDCYTSRVEFCSHDHIDHEVVKKIKLPYDYPEGPYRGRPNEWF